MSAGSAAQALPELLLPAGARVIADLHLDPGRPAGLERFQAWLARLEDAPALVVLGDLFEYWVGPAQAGEGEIAALLGSLAEKVRSGTALHLVHGNRDFLLGREVERGAGARVHPRGFVGRLPGGERVLCIHGDELATLDRSYQRLRVVLRSGWVSGLARSLPLGLTSALARALRGRSQEAVAAKLPEHMELQPAAVCELATQHRARFLVCGHAHRFREEVLAGGVRWTVLDAFGGERDVLAIAPEGTLEVRSSRAGHG